jgi:agmatine deiminase
MMAERRRARTQNRNEAHAIAAALETPRELGYRMPAEWAAHTATWIAWPHQSADWPGKLTAVEWVFVEIVRHLVRESDERARILVPSQTARRRVESLLARAGADLERVDFTLLPTDRSWTRDFLPSFVTRSQPKSGVAAVKWRFNGWARYPNHKRDDAAGQAVARSAPAYFEPTVPYRGVPYRIVLEGGSIDVDGQGTLLTTEECLLTGKRARNRFLGQDGIERALHDYLGIDHVIWLENGIVGDDTSGHIDDFARFVAPGRVVVCTEPNRRDPNHALLRDAKKRLCRARDARGRSLDVIELPMPRPVTFRGVRLPASYANFYIANARVLVPTFNDPADRVALSLLAEAFPDREIVGIHALDLVLGLGTLHCSTQQEPAPPESPRRPRAHHKS